MVVKQLKDGRFVVTRVVQSRLTWRRKVVGGVEIERGMDPGRNPLGKKTAPNGDQSGAFELKCRLSAVGRRW